MRNYSLLDCVAGATGFSTAADCGAACSRALRYVLLTLLVTCCVACKPDVVKSVVEAEVAPPQPTGVEPKKVRSGREVMLSQLLEQAETALGRQRLTKPAHDNAFDKFSAVLLLEPGNTAAQTGLNAVQMQLVNNARESAAKGRLSLAEKQVANIRLMFPKSELVKQLKDDIQQARMALQAKRKQQRQEVENDPNRYLIPSKYLRSDSDEAKAWFAGVAATIRETDASILIYARSDTEGRWVYKALKESLSGYLLRGDIRLSGPPSIQLLEPLP